jgi:hypothetical protein
MASFLAFSKKEAILLLAIGKPAPLSIRHNLVIGAPGHRKGSFIYGRKASHYGGRGR